MLFKPSPKLSHSGDLAPGKQHFENIAFPFYVWLDRNVGQPNLDIPSMFIYLFSLGSAMPPSNYRCVTWYLIRSIDTSKYSKSFDVSQYSKSFDPSQATPGRTPSVTLVIAGASSSCYSRNVASRPYRTPRNIPTRRKKNAQNMPVDVPVISANQRIETV